MRTQRQRDRAQVIIDTIKSIGPLSVTEIADVTEIPYGSVHRLLPHMKKARMIFIKAWRRPEHKGSMAALYGVGRGKDAERPPRRTVAENMKAYRQRHGALIKAREARTRARRKTYGIWEGLVPPATRSNA